MDRISALRNVEEALRAFEAGEADLEATQRRVRNVLQTYATDFETDDRHAFRARGDDAVDGTVVVAASAEQARERVRTLRDAPDASFSVERV